MVNVDTVYQTVQALANKEQRGYLTPQEFNLLANQAQQDIFEQYFYDLNAFRLRGVQLGTGEEFEIGDSTTIVRDKIQRTNGVTYTSQQPLLQGPFIGQGKWDFPPGRNGKIYGTRNGHPKKFNLIDEAELEHLKSGKYWGQDEDWYLFDQGYGRIMVRTSQDDAFEGRVDGATFLHPENEIFCENVVGKPGLVYWGYTIVNEEAVYNPATSKNFDLVSSEQPDLVIKILKLAGVSIEDPQLAGIAAQEEQLNLQQENK